MILLVHKARKIKGPSQTCYLDSKKFKVFNHLIEQVLAPNPNNYIYFALLLTL